MPKVLNQDRLESLKLLQIQAGGEVDATPSNINPPFQPMQSPIG